MKSDKEAIKLSLALLMVVAKKREKRLEWKGSETCPAAAQLYKLNETNKGFVGRTAIATFESGIKSKIDLRLYRDNPDKISFPFR
jgi:hypothetical protein